MLSVQPKPLNNSMINGTPLAGTRMEGGVVIIPWTKLFMQKFKSEFGSGGNPGRIAGTLILADIAQIFKSGVISLPVEQ